MGLFPDHLLEQPVSFDIAASGRMVALDRGGRRLCLAEPNEEPALVPLEARALRCRFHGERIALLEADGVVRSLDAGGRSVGTLRVQPCAVNLAVTSSGSLLVTYGRRGSAEHRKTLERLGGKPLAYEDPALLDATALAVESGGFWIAGTGSESPSARAVRLRPVKSGLKVRAVVGLPAPPRAAAIGPDGALYLVLEPGESLVRVAVGACGPVQRLPGAVQELARGEQALLGCGARGIVDLTHLVPRPEDRPALDLPGC